MEQKKAMRLLQCWLDLENFQRLLLDDVTAPVADWSTVQDDAMVIYDK